MRTITWAGPLRDKKHKSCYLNFDDFEENSFTLRYMYVCGVSHGLWEESDSQGRGNRMVLRMYCIDTEALPRVHNQGLKQVAAACVLRFHPSTFSMH